METLQEFIRNSSIKQIEILNKMKSLYTSHSISIKAMVLQIKKIQTHLDNGSIELDTHYPCNKYKIIVILSTYPKILERFPLLSEFVSIVTPIIDNEEHINNYTLLVYDKLIDQPNQCHILKYTTAVLRRFHKEPVDIDLDENCISTLYEKIKSYNSSCNLTVRIKILSAYYSLIDKDYVGKLLQTYKDTDDISVYIQWFNITPWRKELLAQIQDAIGVVWAVRTAYVEARTTKVLWDAYYSLQYIERYINDTKDLSRIPQNIEPIRWFLHTTTLDQVIKSLVYIGTNYIEPNNLKNRSNVDRHHAEYITAFTITLYKHILYKHMTVDPSSLTLSIILKMIPNKRVNNNLDNRVHYFESEVMKLIAATKNDTKMTLLLTILTQIALRNSAITHLQVKDFVNVDGTFKQSGSKIEKGNVVRYFLISKSLQEALDNYMREFDIAPKDQDRYLFFTSNSKTMTDKPINPSTLLHWIKNLCKECNIEGTFTNVHGFRSYMVNSLMKYGNTISDSSKFIGHKNVATTEKFYYTTSERDIVRRMTIPWMTTSASNAMDYIPDVEIPDAVGPYGIDNVDTMSTCSSIVTSFYKRNPEASVALEVINSILMNIKDRSIDMYQKIWEDIPSLQNDLEFIGGASRSELSSVAE